LHFVVCCIKIHTYIVCHSSFGLKESFSHTMFLALNSTLGFTVEILLHFCLPCAVIFLLTCFLLICLGFFFFLFVLVLRFQVLRASYLLARCSTTWATHPQPFLL
jgi:hypothetical protein